MPVSERTIVLDEILSIYLANVPEKMLKGYLRLLEDIPTDILRRAGARYANSSSQARKPTPFDLRRTAQEIQGEQAKSSNEPQSITALPEHATTVKRLRDWNYCEHEISEILLGRRPVPLSPKRFSDKAWAAMELMALTLHTSLEELGIVRHPE